MAAAPCGVNRLHDCFVETALVYGHRVLAVFGTVIQAADAAPYNLFFAAALGPCCPFVGSETFSAD